MKLHTFDIVSRTEDNYGKGILDNVNAVVVNVFEVEE